MSASHRHRGIQVKLFVLFSALLHFALCNVDVGLEKSVNVPATFQKVIIIADPGVDDAAAILMAVAHPNVDVLAVISNFGIISYQFNFLLMIAFLKHLH